MFIVRIAIFPKMYTTMTVGAKCNYIFWMIWTTITKPKDMMYFEERTFSPPKRGW